MVDDVIVEDVVAVVGFRERDGLLLRREDVCDLWPSHAAQTKNAIDDHFKSPDTA